MEPLNSKANTHSSQAPLVSNKGYTGNANSPKMGSRRIFTPQFKLQVLESYRSDSDCKGNQRATARKYNIHRRQIQKWLQCESSLRSSVANISQNSVKHQFHNISIQQQQQTHKLPITDNSTISNSYNTNQRYSAVPFNTLKASSISTGVSTSSAQSTQRILETTNLQAAVAAAVRTPASMAISSTNTIATSGATTAVMPPLQPSAIITVNRNTNTVSPILHHHYGIQPYNNMSSSNVPILSQHLSHSQQHIHQQNHHLPRSSYQYHNLAYTSPLPYIQIDKQQPSYFTSVNLPTTINALSASSNCYKNSTFGDNKHPIKDNLIQIRSKSYPKFSSESNNFLCNNKQFYSNYDYNECDGTIDSSSMNVPFNINHFKGDVAYSTLFPCGPMDLSLRNRRELKSELVTNIKPDLQNNDFKESKTIARKILNDEINIVDLTYRKRRAFSTTSTVEPYKNEFPEKLPKLTNPEEMSMSELHNNNVKINTSNRSEEEDIEIEVGIEEKFLPAKPVKLFKPYLLDDCPNNDNSNKLTKNGEIELVEKSSSMNITSTSNCDDVPNGSCGENSFQNFIKESIFTCADSLNFLVESRSASPRSAFSPAASVPTMSPTNFQCPKGSPASSGYESSTSTYSESSLSSRSDTYGYGQTYHINLQMHAVSNDNVNVMHPSHQIRRWLDKDESKLLRANSSVALLV